MVVMDMKGRDRLNPCQETKDGLYRVDGVSWNGRGEIKRTEQRAGAANKKHVDSY